MFGISFGKVLLLVALVAIIWFGYRWLQRWDKERRETERRESARLGRDETPEPAPRSGSGAAEEMTACRVCGTYVAASAARACGRPGCPFPRT